MKSRLFALLSFAFFLFQSPLMAQGDLMILPKRIIFDGQDRSKEISLINTGNDTATFAISFIQYHMQDNGEFLQVEEPVEGQRFADPFLRFFPRRVTLPPNEAQTVRLQVTKTNEMTDGEYRSHAYFRAIEKQTALQSEDSNDNEENISINIKTVFGISIPVIIRKGETSANIKIDEIQFDKESGNVSLRLNRTGNASTYGNLKAMFLAEGEKDPVKVGMVKGIAVYTPNNYRNFNFQLQNSENIDLTNGQLIISYENSKGEIFDEQRIILE